MDKIRPSAILTPAESEISVGKETGKLMISQARPEGSSEL